MARTPEAFAPEHLARWAQIRIENGIRTPLLPDGTPDQERLRPDIDHSALLNRLAAGQEPLPEPPPKSHNYSWYSLVETGEGKPVTAWHTPDLLDVPCVVIDQSPWALIETLGPKDWVVAYYLPDVAEIARRATGAGLSLAAYVSGPFDPSERPERLSESRWRCRAIGQDRWGDVWELKRIEVKS